MQDPFSEWQSKTYSLLIAPIEETIFHLRPLRAGSGAKIVNNTVMHAEMVVLLQAAAMAEKLRISTGRLAEILSQPRVFYVLWSID